MEASESASLQSVLLIARHRVNVRVEPGAHDLVLEPGESLRVELLEVGRDVEVDFVEPDESGEMWVDVHCFSHARFVWRSREGSPEPDREMSPGLDF